MKIAFHVQGQVISLTLSIPLMRNKGAEDSGSGQTGWTRVNTVSKESHQGVKRPLTFALSSQENFPLVKIPSQTIRQIYDGLIMPQKRITGQEERFPDLRAACSKCDD